MMVQHHHQQYNDNETNHATTVTSPSVSGSAVSSARALFEANIHKNHTEYGGSESKSFLTNLAVVSRSPSGCASSPRQRQTRRPPISPRVRQRLSMSHVGVGVGTDATTTTTTSSSAATSPILSKRASFSGCYGGSNHTSPRVGMIPSPTIRRCSPVTRRVSMSTVKEIEEEYNRIMSLDENKNNKNNNREDGTITKETDHSHASTESMTSVSTLTSTSSSSNHNPSDDDDKTKQFNDRFCARLPFGDEEEEDNDDKDDNDQHQNSKRTSSTSTIKEKTKKNSDHHCHHNSNGMINHNHKTTTTTTTTTHNKKIDVSPVLPVRRRQSLYEVVVPSPTASTTTAQSPLTRTTSHLAQRIKDALLVRNNAKSPRSESNSSSSSASLICL